MGMLTLAGVVSGGGKALQQGLQQTQQYMNYSMLQKERDEMERARMDITYGRELGVLQMKHRWDTEAADTAHSRALDREDQRQDFESSENRKTREAGRQTAEMNAQREMEREEKRQQNTVTNKVLDASYEQQKDATKTKQELSKEERERKFQREKMQTEGGFRLTEQMLQNQRPLASGAASAKLDPNTNAQLKVYADRIGRLEDEMNNVMTKDSRRDEIRKEIAKLEGKQNELLGMASTKQERAPIRWPE